MFTPHRSAQWLRRKSAGIYSIRDGGGGLPMHVSAAPDHHSPPSNRYSKTFPSSDSSLIPFAGQKAIGIESMKQLRNPPRDNRRNLEVTTLETPGGEIFPRVDGRRTKEVQRRSRHKMRNSHEKKKKKSSINQKKSRDAHLKVDALINDFSADHLTKDRLTVCRSMISTKSNTTDSLDIIATSISSSRNI